MAKTIRRKLTALERECAQRINKLWLEKKRAEKISQPVAAEALQMTTSGFNQYVNGKIPLNTDATYKFAIYFGVDPRDIDPRWLGGDVRQRHAEFEAILKTTNKAQDLAAVKAIAGRTSAKDAIKFARLFLDRVEAGL
jgi:plasmid maintenance system antidote protein VapI